MPRATLAAVRKQIESGRPDPVYLISGDDEHEKSSLVAAFTALIDEELRAFNIQRFHAVDMMTGDKLMEGVGSIVNAVRTVPMLSPRRVIFVMQAEHLIAPKRESEAATRASPCRTSPSGSSASCCDRRIWRSAVPQIPAAAAVPRRTSPSGVRRSPRADAKKAGISPPRAIVASG